MKPYTDCGSPIEVGDKFWIADFGFIPSREGTKGCVISAFRTPQSAIVYLHSTSTLLPAIS